MKLDAKRAALLVVDIQEKLIPAMRADDVARVVKNTNILLLAAKTLGLPVVVSQQYPKGLGATIADVNIPHDAHRYDKMDFSSAPGLPITAEQWIICGMETHVCVFQTIRDLRAQHIDTFLAADAVCSRADANYQTGIGLARDLGAHIYSTEVAVFDLLERAGTEQFKVLSKAVR